MAKSESQANQTTIQYDQRVSGLGAGAFSGLQRRSIIVSNKDPNNALELRDADDHVILTVFPETSITLPISGSVEIYNPGASAVALNVSELWWENP
ncbi:MAG: hypothetical protein ACREIA_01570 [Opitutaceae bacterium]